MLEMKAYYCLNEPVANSEIYITNNPKIRKMLNQLGAEYQGWALEDQAPYKEAKAPTLKISSVPAIQGNLAESPKETPGVKINEVILLLNNNSYRLFDDYDQFVRLEKFNKLPGRMLTFLVSMLLLWFLWYLFFGK